MGNMMITHAGALGDCIWEIPALNVLQEYFDKIYQCGQIYGKLALEGTGLIDQFIVKPKEFKEWEEDYQREWLEFQSQEMEWDVCVNLHKVVAGKYMFHSTDPQFEKPIEWKQKLNEGVSYFDAMTLRFQEQLDIDLSEAIGKRPITKHTEEEEALLKGFRWLHEIPEDAFLLGWQFTGSSRCKWYPFFQQVIQMNIMQKYPKVYLIGLGDLDGLIVWGSEYHHGRFINLKKTLTFRQAYVFTSMLDLLVSPETGIYNAAQAYAGVSKILLATHTTGKHITIGDESVILAAECDCGPCYDLLHGCKIDPESNAPYCISSIKPPRLIAAIEEVIERKSRMDSLQIKGIMTVDEVRQALK